MHDLYELKNRGQIWLGALSVKSALDLGHG